MIDREAVAATMRERPAFRLKRKNPTPKSADFASSSASSRAREKLRIEKSKRSGEEGGIRTHGRDALNQEVRKIYGSAVPCNPLASPDFAVDLAIAGYH
jgi:hypothetical protein